MNVLRLQGNLSGVVVSHTDVTSRKLAQDALRNAKNKLDEQNDALQATEEELRQQIDEYEVIQTQLQETTSIAESANSAKSQFLANMSHEIRTPMNGVLGMTQLLEFTDLSEEQREYVALLKLSGNNLLSLLNDILDLSKIEAGKLEIEKSEFSLSACMRDLALMQKAVISAKGLKLDLVIAEDIPHVLIGDQLRIKQILLNLLGNAVKFTVQGKISISVQLLEKHDNHVLVQLAVRDSGIGIAPEALDTVFKAFAQEDGSTTRRFGGTGLGLTISRRLAELMGGIISVYSTQGVGSCFTVTLPFMIGCDTTAVQDVNPITTIGWDGPPLRILFVEDDHTNIIFGSSLLNKLGFDFIVAENGRECLAALEKGTFDLVLMDIQMPFMNGEEALLEIRAQERVSGVHMPVIAVTAYSMRGDKERFLNKGFDGYVLKPITTAELVKEIKRVVGERDAAQ
jgi:signal transduction histidine kinase/ActR/RegA family two-component response regulator